jgi:hypothetical protein
MPGISGYGSHIWIWKPYLDMEAISGYGNHIGLYYGV